MKAKYILAAITTLVIFGCSKENNGNINTNSVITTLEGKTVLVKKYGSTSYGYNLEGRLIKVGDMLFDYTNNELLYSESQKSFGTFKINSNGYLTELLEKASNDNETYEVKFTFSYDKSGYLTAYTYSENGSYSEDSGNISSISENISGTITWTNGSIASISESSTYRESDGKIDDIEEESYSTTFTCDSRNLVGQHAGADVWTDFDALYTAGILGKAPSNHPTKAVVSYSSTRNGEYESGNYSYKFNYLYGTDGTITKESYTYDDGYTGQLAYAYQDFIPTTKGLDFSLESTDDEASCTNHTSILKNFRPQLRCPDRFSK